MNRYSIFVALLALIFNFETEGQIRNEVPKQYSSYRPNPHCNPSYYFEYPKTTEDVQKIVKFAIANKLTVKAMGSRHSQTDIICTEGIPIDTNGLISFQMNSDYTATIGAGVSLHDATTFLRKHGRGLRTTPGFGNITLGGAIGTGAHGSSIKYTSSISEQVVGVIIVDGLGNIRNITETEDLRALRVHLGLLGIVTNVTLVTVPLYKTRGHNYVVDDSVLTDGTIIQWAQTADQMSIYWFPSNGKVVIANWTIVDVNTPGNANTNDHVPPFYGVFNLFAKFSFEQVSVLTQSSCNIIKSIAWNVLNNFQFVLQLTLYRYVPLFANIYETNGIFQNPAVGYYDLMFAPTCIDGKGPVQCLWGHGKLNANITILDNEISLKLSDLASVVNSVKNIASKAPALFPLQGILMRFSAASKSYMSNAYGRDTVHFEWLIFNRINYKKDASPGTAAYQTIMQTLANKYSGRSHWGKTGAAYHTLSMIDLKMDPTARSKFVAAMNKFDPNEVFINNFGRRIKSVSAQQDLPPSSELPHCALLDYCFCSRDSDCAAYQTCTTLEGYSNYTVCQTKGEFPVTFLPIAFSENPIAFLNKTLAALPSVVKTLAQSTGCLFERVSRKLLILLG